MLTWYRFFFLKKGRRKGGGGGSDLYVMVSLENVNVQLVVWVQWTSSDQMEF